MISTSRCLRASVLLACLSLFGVGCTKALPPETQKASERVNISVWGVIEDVDVYQPLFAEYRAAHPQVAFNFRRLRLEEYENKLLNGFAEDRGPDIFLLHNTWLGKYINKISPMPPITKVAYSVTTGSVKKETTWELQQVPTIALRDFKEQFADVVVRDALRTVKIPSPTATPGSSSSGDAQRQERVVAAPIWVDTMAMYYNKDLLNAAGIATAPENWRQFQEAVEKLTRLDAEGGLLQSAAGIGTARNVERAADLLSVLMIQNGAPMTTRAGGVTFDQPPEGASSRDGIPALQALEFYTDFANPAKKTFTWDKNQPNSLEAFMQGRTAFFFGYAYHMGLIKAQAPKIHLGVSKLPQIEGNSSKNFANYWLWAVSKKSQNTDVVWNFLNYLMQPDTTKKILTKVKRPAARKSLLQDQFNDEDVGVFASQVLTAQSWYRGNNPKIVDEAFAQLIERSLTGTDRVYELLNFAANQVRQTLGEPND